MGIPGPLAGSGYLVDHRTERDHEPVGRRNIVDPGETGNVEEGVRRNLDSLDELKERRLSSWLYWLSQGRELLEGGACAANAGVAAGVGVPYPAKNTRTTNTPIACWQA